MILIAHRGNVEGRDPSRENHPEYIQAALDQYVEVEADVWWTNEKFYLGHDGPTYEVATEFFRDTMLLWCHAKTPQTLQRLLALYAHCFYIEDDWECVLTSQTFIWTSPNGTLTGRSVAVMPEYSNWSRTEVRKARAVCSDDLTKWM